MLTIYAHKKGCDIPTNLASVGGKKKQKIKISKRFTNTVQTTMTNSVPSPLIDNDVRKKYNETLDINSKFSA